MRTYLYTVTGAGRFPLDMLRYDMSWPDDQESVARMMSPPPGNRYEVNLRSIDIPKSDRWLSFGWKLGSVKT
jgi:hypothetical protein